MVRWFAFKYNLNGWLNEDRLLVIDEPPKKHNEKDSLVDLKRFLVTPQNFIFLSRDAVWSISDEAILQTLLKEVFKFS